MNAFVDKLFNDNFVWDRINQAIPARRRAAGTSFVNFNCPMCSSMGHRPDRKFRCGVVNNNPGVGVHCFNCGFKALWKPGEPLSQPMRSFMSVLGVSEREIKIMSLRAAQTQRLLSDAQCEGLSPARPYFTAAPLPPGAKTIETWAQEGCEDPDFLDAVDYMFSRGNEVIRDHVFYWSPDKSGCMNKRLIIPFKANGEIVGYTARAFGAEQPRYLMHSQPNYLFNFDLIYERHRKFLFLVEGPFDALAIDGIGLLGARLNDQQARWLSDSGKTIIVVPDRDKKAGVLIDIAIDHRWAVAFPTFRDGAGRDKWWDSDIKDCAEAVKRHGRLWVVRSLLETATSNAIEIGLKRRIFV